MKKILFCILSFLLALIWLAPAVVHAFLAAPPFLESPKTPVLIVPGVTGTELVKDQETLWPNITRMLFNVWDDFMDPLAFSGDLAPTDAGVEPTGVITKKATFDYTQGLLDEFTAHGYETGRDVFTFPYDWRFGVSDAIITGLDNKIQDIVNQTGSQEVDVVAHSTGGLLVKKYAQIHDDHHIRKLIMVGVPNLGAPKAIKTLLQGDNLGVPGLSEAEIAKLAKNFPVIYQLAPSAKYYAAKGSYVRVSDIDADGSVAKRDLSFSETDHYLLDDHAFNGLALERAKELHNLEFDNFDLRTKGLDVYSIVGCKRGTIGQINELRHHERIGTIISYDKPLFVPGDGTVPLESATNLPIASDHKYFALKADHAAMMSQSGIRQEIVRLLTGDGSINVGSAMTQDINQCKLKGKAISIYSPVSIDVTTVQGNRLGPAPDGSLENTLTNAGFEQFGEHKFAYLPTDEGQEYDIKLNGQGSGTFTLRVDSIEGDAIATTEVFPNVPVNRALAGRLSISGTASLAIDSDGNGTNDEILMPNTISRPDIADTAAPVTKAILHGAKGQANYYRSDVAITLAANDPSGIITTQYRIDNEPTIHDYGTAPVIVRTEGRHTLDYYSVDWAGNVEAEKSETFIIDKTAPELFWQFDPAIRDIRFQASGNEPDDIVVNDQGNQVSATDQAGNSTVLTFQEKDRKRGLRLNLQTLTNGASVAALPKTKLSFSWKYQRDSLRQIVQKVRSRNNFGITAVYNGQLTKISGRDKSGKFSKALPGLVLLKVGTSQGSLIWSY